jgi:hypothetical protein
MLHVLLDLTPIAVLANTHYFSLGFNSLTRSEAADEISQVLNDPRNQTAGQPPVTSDLLSTVHYFQNCLELVIAAKVEPTVIVEGDRIIAKSSAPFPRETIQVDEWVEIQIFRVGLLCTQVSDAEEDEEK